MNPQRRFLPFCCEITLNNQEDQVGKKKTEPLDFLSGLPFPLLREKEKRKENLFQEAHILIFLGLQSVVVIPQVDILQFHSFPKERENLKDYFSCSF